MTRLIAALACTAAAAPVLAAPPANIPNSTLYRDSGLHAATGRSGNASLTARGLLGKDGVTTLDATTGALDTGNAPGNFSKVQIKVYAPDTTTVTAAKNYNALSAGGAFETTYTGLVRHQQLQVQANIDGIDRRTDVVTVQETVKLRPDFASGKITAPAQAYVNANVNIAGVVSELNGDVGAHADCDLSVDGSVVDQAVGIWVDANSSVSCAFTHAFTATGTHTITITAANVVPGDWDTLNNSASQTIQIVSQGGNVPFWYWAGAYDQTFNYSGNYDIYENGSTTPVYTNNWSANGWYEGSYLYGWSNHVMQFPLAVNVSQTAAGQSLSVYQNSSMNPTWQWSQGTPGSAYYYQQACSWDWQSYSYFYLCTYQNNWYGESWQGTWTEAGSYGGDVTYHANGYCGVWQWGCNGYSWNYDGSWAWGGTHYDISKGVQFSFKVTDANGSTLAAAPLIGTSPFDWNWGGNWNGSWNYNTDYFTSSETWQEHYYGYQGWVSGYSGP